MIETEAVINRVADGLGVSRGRVRYNPTMHTLAVKIGGEREIIVANPDIDASIAALKQALEERNHDRK